MTTPLSLTEPTEIMAWLKFHAAGEFRESKVMIQASGVSYDGDLRLNSGYSNNRDMTLLPFHLDVIYGTFVMKGFHGLTSLKGLPRVIKGDLFLKDCLALTSLEHGPLEVEGACIFENLNKLKTLAGCPKTKSITCRNNNLETLEGLPAVTELQLGSTSKITDWSLLPTSITDLYLPDNCTDIPYLPNLELLDIMWNSAPFPEATTRWMLDKDVVVSVFNDDSADLDEPVWCQLMTTDDILEKARLFEELYGTALIQSAIPEPSTTITQGLTL